MYAQTIGGDVDISVSFKGNGIHGYIEYLCPKCKKEFSQVPDNLHFHYWCEKCDKEYELDGVTKWKDK